MTSIKVAVRCRPLLDGERATTALDVQCGGRRIVLDNKTYDPDYTLPPSATQDDVYALCKPILQSVKEGVNGTVMVYGQTGTGKTHTMLGSGDGRDDGVVHMAIAELLEHAQSRAAAAAAVTLSMIEIYNERLSDMLSAGGEDEVTLVNGWPRFAHKVTVSCVDEVHDVVARGLAVRHTAATLMNERSSRSHVVFLVDLAEHNAFTDTADVTHLVLVDLAGSESLKKSQASGSTASETGKINRSLLALKSVLLALANTNEATRPAHVPYRDSKLTELLQDSLGGSARTLLIACISAVGRDLDETRSTLLYAVKARTIRNAANTDREKLLLRLRSAEVDNVKLRNRLQERVMERGGYFVTRDEHEAMERQTQEVAQLREDVAALSRAHDDREAHKHIAAAQAQYYVALLADKERALQCRAQSYAAAVRRFDQQATRLQQLVQATVTAARGSADAAAARTCAALRQWHDGLLQQLEEHNNNDHDDDNTTTTNSSNNKDEWLVECDEACARVVQRLQSSLTQLTQQMLHTQTQLREALSHATQQRSSAVARVCAELRAAVDSGLAQLRMVDERATRDEEAALHEMDAQLRSAEQAMQLSSPAAVTQSLQTVMRRACTATVRSVHAVLPAPTAVEDVHTALDAVVTRHRQLTTSFALTNVSPLSTSSLTTCAELMCSRGGNNNNDGKDTYTDDTVNEGNMSSSSTADGSDDAAAAAAAATTTTTTRMSLPSSPLTAARATTTTTARRSRFSELGSVGSARGSARGEGQRRRATLPHPPPPYLLRNNNSNNNNNNSNNMANVLAASKRSTSNRSFVVGSSSSSRSSVAASQAATAASSARARASAQSRYSVRSRCGGSVAAAAAVVSNNNSNSSSSSGSGDTTHAAAVTTMPPPSTPPPQQQQSQQQRAVGDASSLSPLPPPLASSSSSPPPLPLPLSSSSLSSSPSPSVLRRLRGSKRPRSVQPPSAARGDSYRHDENNNNNVDNAVLTTTPTRRLHDE